ncbi:hypothetical protein N9N08_00095 [bacterium]|nr:hypothetical protein [bacterium]
MKILVCGDSYATLDPCEGHWANLWAKENGYDVTHEGFAGESHVNIITKLLARLDISDYNFIIYNVTDFLRAEIDIEGNSLSNVLDKTLDIYSDSNFTNKQFMETQGWPVNISPNGLDPNFPQDEICKEKTFNFYNSINLYWLVQANYNSLLLLVEKCKTNNIPIVFVIEPDMSETNDPEFYPEGSSIFTTRDYGKNKQTYYYNRSTNHFNKHVHKGLADMFSSFINNNNILKQ